MAAVERTLLLINPKARSGDLDHDELLVRLRESGPVIAPPCTEAGSMERAIATHADKVDRIVIGGGDGTLNGALKSVLEVRLPLGVLPLGTANDFARSLGIADVGEAIDAILAGHTRNVDIGVVNDHHFLNAVGIGLGPQINRELDSQSKKKLGVASYLLHALRLVGKGRGVRAVIECDGQAVSVRSMQITIGNGIHYGGGMTISDEASLSDGILRVLSIRPQSFLSLLTYGPAIRSGHLENDENLQVFSGRKVVVRTRHETDVTADGERITHTPVECHSLPGALEVYSPAEEESQ